MVLRPRLIALCLCWAPLAAVPAQEGAAIASAHPLASAAGMEVLADGGNAFDAAVAVSAVLAVVEPYSSGLGGGGFYLLHRAEDGREVVVDGREVAPAAASRDMYLDEAGGFDPQRVLFGALAPAIPGTPAALAHISARYGRLPLARSLAPAIRLAEQGFELDPRFADMTVRYHQRLLTHCEPGCPFLEDGRPLRTGMLLVQPALAETLRRLAADGAAAFYRGEVAQAMVTHLRSVGGIWTEEDLAAYRVVERAPAVGSFRGHRIVTVPPPSSGGITLLQSLALVDALAPPRSPAERVHLLAEVWRLAYRDRNEYLGDPAFVQVPADLMLHPAYLAGLAAGVERDRAGDSRLLPSVLGPREGGTTTHFSILDAEGNRVAATQTVNFRFGSGLVDPRTGVTLNNEMDDFAAQPGQPNGFGLVQGEANAVQPGKRPLSSMTPTIIEGPRGGAVLGTPGGSRIISMVTLAVLAYVDGADAAAIAALPRFHHQYLPDEIQYEPGALPPELLAALAELGHATAERPSPYGNMNIVTWDAQTGAVSAATDPRNTAYADF